MKKRDEQRIVLLDEEQNMETHEGTWELKASGQQKGLGSRLMAQGFTQDNGIDHEKTFNTLFKFRSAQFDMKTASFGGNCPDIYT